MVTIRATYEGQLRTRCVHAPSGAELVTDAPVDNEGKGESFSPTDLVATALASCVLTIMGIAARRHAWKLEGARARIEKHMVTDPERRIGRLVLHLELPAGLDARARTTLENAAHACPVHRSLRAELEIEMNFEYVTEL